MHFADAVSLVITYTTLLFNSTLCFSCDDTSCDTCFTEEVCIALVDVILLPIVSTSLLLTAIQSCSWLVKHTQHDCVYALTLRISFTLPVCSALVGVSSSDVQRSRCVDFLPSHAINTCMKCAVSYCCAWRQVTPGLNIAGYTLRWLVIYLLFV